MFCGRKEELEILNKRYNSNQFEFGFIYGQRRIGKTTLVNEFKKNHNSLIFFASDTDDVTLKDDFSREFFKQTNQNNLSSFSTWQDFFSAIAGYFVDKHGLVVFDEYPNIIQTHDGKRKNTDFDYKLQNAIDSIFKTTKITIVIMGSNVSFMERIINDKKGPLYERHTFSLLISKLKWKESLEFVKGMNIDDQIKILSLTDTYPFFLSHINKEKSFDDNLNNMFFNRDSLIAMDPTSAISSNINITGFYDGIMRCLASGINTIKDISLALKAESGKVSLYLAQLIEGKAVRKCVLYNSDKKTYYEINDRMTAFYFRFVHPYIELIKLGQGLNIRAREENAIKEFLEHSYEKLCMTYLENLNSENVLESYFLSFYRFSADNTSLGRSVEIDIIASEGNNLLVGECKFSKNKKGLSEYYEMKEDTNIKPLNTYKNKYYYLFSHSGFDERLLKFQDDKLHLISSKEMLMV